MKKFKLLFSVLAFALAVGLFSQTANTVVNVSVTSNKKFDKHYLTSYN